MMQGDCEKGQAQGQVGARKIGEVDRIVQVDGRVEEGQEQVDQGPKGGCEQVERIVGGEQGDRGEKHDSKGVEIEEQGSHQKAC